MSQFTDQQKLAAVEYEIIRRKRMFGLKPEDHKLRQIDVMKAVASDYRKRIAATGERTDEGNSDGAPSRMAGGMGSNAGPPSTG